MKNFKEWQIENENYSYTPSIDGPPLKPHTISGAEVQIRQLAMHIRTTFNLDERWKQYHEEIYQATKLLDKAASMIGIRINSDGRKTLMSGEERNAPHKFHSDPNKKDTLDSWAKTE